MLRKVEVFSDTSKDSTQLLLLAVLIQLIMESMSHRSIIGGFGFIVTNPLMFLFNTFLILFTLSFSRLFSRQNVIMALVVIFWLGISFANFIVQSYRLTPLSYMDFYNLSGTLQNIAQHLSLSLTILVLVLLLLFLVTLVILGRKAKKHQRNWKECLLLLGISTIMMIASSTWALHIGSLSNHYPNLMDAYKDYGFVYCFTTSMIDRGIHKPGDYNEQELENLWITLEKNKKQVDNTNNNTNETSNEIANETSKETSNEIANETSKETSNEIINKKPNVIMIQLESFFDVNYLASYRFSENPVPNFTRLKKEYTSGFLTVPVYGAGTINTEFEVLSGMSTSYFGTGEYPYRTILNKSTCESIGYNLMELGYQSYIIHNNTATFYNRLDIFPKLGFDHFISIEYMNEVEYNMLGWSKDKVLTKEILKALQAKDTRDFIYTISVQPHGKYPTTKTKNLNIQVDKKISDNQIAKNQGVFKSNRKGVTEEEYRNQLEYYVNQLAQTDKFIGELTKELSTYKEPVILVLFGDHLPPLSIDDEDLTYENRYQTEYVLWSNYPMERENSDLAAYQLNAYVMERMGYDNGILTKLHQYYADQADYEEKLELLQYDMLYGNQYIFQWKNPYEAKDMKMGIYDPKITKVNVTDHNIVLQGENFTPYSIVYVNDSVRDTVFVDDKTIEIPLEDLKNKHIYVAQTSGKTILSKSKEYMTNY